MKKTALERIVEDGGDEMALDPRTRSIGACNPTTLLDGDPNELLFSHDDFNDDDDDDEDDDNPIFSDEADD